MIRITRARTQSSYNGHVVRPKRFIPRLTRELRNAKLYFKEIRYIDQCGCGGYVTRIYR